MRVRLDYHTIDTQGVDENNLPVGDPSVAASQTQQFSAAGAAGGVVLAWSDASTGPGGIASVDAVTVWQQNASGAWVVVYSGPGQGASVNGGTGPVVRHSAQYNAFGELERSYLDGQLTEYYDHDSAGHVWRTNAGDGVDRVMLYDAVGHVTAEVRSAGNGAIAALSSADQVDHGYLTDSRRTEMRCDLLGRMVQQTLPQAGASDTASAPSPYVLTSSFSAAITGQATLTYDENGLIAGWSGTNTIALHWGQLGQLGNGLLRVELDDHISVATLSGTPFGHDEAGHLVDENGNEITTVYSAGPIETHSYFLASNNGSDGTVQWTGPGLNDLARVRIYKQDAAGNWQLMVDSPPSGGQMPWVVMSKPADATGPVKIEVSPSGQNNWSVAQTIDFGDMLMLADGALAAGNYDYRVSYFGAQDVQASADAAPPVKSSGLIAATAATLATISSTSSFAGAVLRWADPGSGVVQTFHYRAVGASGWQTAAVTAAGTGNSGVDLSGLAALGAGSYEYELLYTVSGQTYAYAHATGSVTIGTGTPAQVVPAVGTPHLPTTLAVAGARIGDSYTGTTTTTTPVLDENGNPLLDENGNPITTSVTRDVYAATGHASRVLRWSSSYLGAEFRYRLVGATDWTNLPVQLVTDSVDSSGNATGVGAGVDVADLAVGNYEVQLLAPNAASVTALLTGTLSVPAVTPGHYETQTVAVQVPVTITPEDPSHFIVGTDESGLPIYGPPVVVGTDEAGQPIYGQGYTREILSTDEDGTPTYGNVIAVPYTGYETQYQEQQVWVPGNDGTPSIADTTPPYTASYVIPASGSTYARPSVRRPRPAPSA